METNQSRLVKLPTIVDGRGKLIFVQDGVKAPFDVIRVFCISGVPVGARRGGHALRTCKELIVAVCGGFDAISDDGNARTCRRLDSAESGLYVPALTWLELENFSRDAVCLVLASEAYSETAHISIYSEFRAAAAASLA